MEDCTPRSPNLTALICSSPPGSRNLLIVRNSLLVGPGPVKGKSLPFHHHLLFCCSAPPHFPPGWELHNSPCWLPVRHAQMHPSQWWNLILPDDISLLLIGFCWFLITYEANTLPPNDRKDILWPPPICLSISCSRAHPHLPVQLVELLISQHRTWCPIPQYSWLSTYLWIFFTKYIEKMLEIWCNLKSHFLFSSLHYCKSMGYDTCHVQNRCESTVYITGKASSHQ